MSALQRLLYIHMQTKGVLLTDGSEKDKKVSFVSSSTSLKNIFNRTLPFAPLQFLAILIINYFYFVRDGVVPRRWWTPSCSWGRSAIIRFCSNKLKKRMPSILAWLPASSKVPICTGLLESLSCSTGYFRNSNAWTTGCCFSVKWHPSWQLWKISWDLEVTTYHVLSFFF